MSSTIQMPKAVPAPASVPPRRVRRRLSVPDVRTIKGQFILQAALILVVAAVLTLVSAMTLNRASNDLNTINSGSIPSVNSALAITQYIEVIDAQAADYLGTASLTTLKPCSISGLNTTVSLTNHTCDERNIDAEIVQVNQTLFVAAHNVTYVGEQTAIERITIGLESYLGDIHEMRADYDLAVNKTDPTDKNLQLAYQAYLNASSILHDQINLSTLGTSQIPLNKEAHLPNCTLSTGQVLTPDQWTQGGLTTALDCLSSINYTHLQGGYGDTHAFLGGATAAIVILSILLAVLLIFGMGRMMLKSHRVLHVALLAAILLSLVFSFAVIGLLSSLQGQASVASQDGAFRQLVQDDYLSIYDSALLNRVSTNANADESRWLIALEFNDQANVAHWQDDWNSSVQQINSLIQGAHNNQTWVEEIQPLKDIDTYWGQYHTIDGQIRSAAQNQSDPKRLLTAETISTGPSNQAFGQFTNAVTRLSSANQGHYNQTFDSINGTLMLYFLLSLVLFPLAGLLALLGIALRLKDF